MRGKQYRLDGPKLERISRPDGSSGISIPALPGLKPGVLSPLDDAPAKMGLEGQSLAPYDFEARNCVVYVKQSGFK